MINNQIKRRPKNKKRPPISAPTAAFSSTFNADLPISNRIHTCLKYKETLTFTLAFNAAAYYQFNLNSLFDPNETGTGHQPYRYDQLTPNLYTRYRVYATSWKVEFINASSAYFCTVVPTNGDFAVAPIGAATFSATGELPYAVSSGVGAGAPNAKFRGRIELNELGGHTASQYNSDDRFQALYNANPTERMYLNLVTFWPSVLGNIDIHVSVEMCFECELMDPPISAAS